MQEGGTDAPGFQGHFRDSVAYQLSCCAPHYVVRYTDAFLAVFIAWIGALQLARSLWIPSFVTGLIIFVHHAVLVIVAVVTTKEGAEVDSLSAPGARAIESAFVLAMLLVSAITITSNIRHSEREARVDFVLKYRTKHRRDISERLVGSMLPGPIAADVRIAVENGLPPSLAWRFDAVRPRPRAWARWLSL